MSSAAVNLEDQRILRHIVRVADKLTHEKTKSAARALGIFSRLVEEAGAAARSGQMVEISAKMLKGTWMSRFGSAHVEELVIPKRTFLRRQARKQNLSADEADRALRLARIAAQADRVFGAQSKADHWLDTPNPKFSGQKPLALLRTDAGAAAVEETLYQIEHGIFA